MNLEEASVLPFISSNPSVCAAARSAKQSPDFAWELMDRLMQELDDCDRAIEQIRMTLEAVRQSLAANVVFWFDMREDRLHVAADTQLPEAWGRAVMTAVNAQSQTTEGLAARSVGNHTDNGRETLALRPGSWAASEPQPKNLDRRLDAFRLGGLFASADLRILSLARRMLHHQRRQASTHGKLKETLIGFVRCMTATIDAKDHTTGGHSERVARIAVRLGKEMGLPETVLGDLYLAGILHDIGKIGVQDSILQKPGKLTLEEFAHLKQHVIIGDRIISNLKPFHHLRPGVRNHHERWDGLGYPDGLRGEETPVVPRILAVADSLRRHVVAASLSRRDADRHDGKQCCIGRGAGSQWDTRIIDHFMDCRDDLYSICFDGGGEMIAVAVERAALVTDSSVVVAGSV